VAGSYIREVYIQMIESTETCVSCGAEFDYVATDITKLVTCPYCHKKQPQCNMCDWDTVICTTCALDK
jgi:DNA-directed RNA polymerase subunit RPC12/RpoP